MSNCSHQVSSLELIDFNVANFYGGLIDVKGICCNCNRIIKVNYQLHHRIKIRDNVCRLEGHNINHWSKINPYRSRKQFEALGKCGVCSRKISALFIYNKHDWLDSNLPDKKHDLDWKEWGAKGGMTTDKILDSFKKFKREFPNKDLQGAYNAGGEPIDFYPEKKVKSEIQKTQKPQKITEAMWVRVRDYT